MEFIKEEDLELITTCALKEVNKADFDKLKHIYEKLEHICILLQSKGYIYDIRKDPRKQAGQSGFVFQEYQWAKIYPKEYYDAAKNKFAYIIGFTDVVHFHLMGIKEYQEKPASKSASKKCLTEIDIDESNYEKIIEDFIQFDKKYRNLFIETGAALGIKEFIKIKQNMEDRNIINLLRYKKQIILQGPPGTGKTKLAKEIASALTDQFQLNENDLADLLKIDDRIPSVKGDTEYKVENIDDKKVILSGYEIQDKNITFEKIKDFFKQNDWNQSVGNGNDRGAYAIAYFIYKKKQQSEKVKIIQFHPSYSYEDFVRGIVAETTGENITYKVKNNLLGEFAACAYNNYLDAHKNINELQKEKLFDMQFDKFVSQIESELSQAPIQLTPSVKLVTADSDAFIYNGNDWQGRIVYSQLKKLYNYDINSIDDVHQHPDIAKHIIYRTPYYFSVLNRLREFISSLPSQEIAETPTTSSLKNYVLLIDEINRANLSSVLGELVYALEYRGEKVESMYKLDDESNKLVLPPNLYIIGTMNTADRSVGHIDYAIRRRFAFVDVLPKDLSGEEKVIFDTDLFKKISSLFISNYDEYAADNNTALIRAKTLSEEFEPKDVWLGHSYFIDKSVDGGSMSVRLQYEIKPILLEYVKDGILVGQGIKEEIEKLS